mmetsp:Transcript_52568/g.111644  ORF Transcript_52568/g.111644 Transcript_52568/m.111644 type:complete len:89 (-) Transcript_52568:274-540(-)
MKTHVTLQWSQQLYRSKKTQFVRKAARGSNERKRHMTLRRPRVKNQPFKMQCEPSHISQKSSEEETETRNKAQYQSEIAQLQRKVVGC